MSAPKTREGRAAALAKRKETTRPRPIKELRQALEDLSKRFRYADDGDGSYRKDIDQLGRIVAFAAGFMHEKPLGPAMTESLELFADALLDIGHERILPYRQLAVFDVSEDGLRDLKAAIERRRTAQTELRRDVNNRIRKGLVRSDGTIDLAHARIAIKSIRMSERT